MLEMIPLVIVEGFLGGAGPFVWGNFEHCLNASSSETRPVFFASVGPVSSLHDRACELYYQLMGGTVDYGEQHSKTHRHGRYGRKHRQGLYPQWSIDSPLHFLGHSMGGPTIIKLQYLLKQSYFGGRGHPDMILSVTTISSPFRGTPIVYTLGEHIDAAPAVRPWSIGDLIAKFVHIIAYLKPLLPESLDIWHSECRSLSFHEIPFSGFLRELWKSSWATSRDAAPFDVTFMAADEREAKMEGEPNPGTFYKSFAAFMTQKDTTHTPAFKYSISVLPVYLTYRLIAKFDLSSVLPVPSFLQGRDLDADTRMSCVCAGAERSQNGYGPNVEEGLYMRRLSPSEISDEYRENDGVVPVFSQWHPLPCRMTRCRHYPVDRPSKPSVPEPGVWHTQEVADATHASIVPFWLSTSRQRVFWIEVGDWLRKIDEAQDLRN
ncbi:alpha/beta-hydrolase [Desarmillaria tabescens]|uniref:Alpha/beta-hydrolase n=1 Tax=Armillaria tabescens TaxID=1929756 RepID=A0AA39NIY3_ARMTA|nr:alpha/beta-hydrolase [Desarmillaria tabescens]KAK0466442.1 alpha/beta-hydrolase [Desarmillaria tabescens]